MHSKAFYMAKVSEAEALARATPPGNEREALLHTAEHWRELGRLAEWAERAAPESSPAARSAG